MSDSVNLAGSHAAAVTGMISNSAAFDVDAKYGNLHAAGNLSGKNQTGFSVAICFSRPAAGNYGTADSGSC